jgi:hypothetical protein
MYERGMLEKYKSWKAKKLETHIDTNVLNFFETNPTEEQILIVSHILRSEGQLSGIYMLIMLFGGLIAGLFIGIGTMI